MRVIYDLKRGKIEFLGFSDLVCRRHRVNSLAALHNITFYRAKSRSVQLAKAGIEKALGGVTSLPLG
jgi:hypothetical protein